MKKLLFLLLISFVSFGQVGEKKYEKQWNKLGELFSMPIKTSYIESNGVKTYKIQFQNQKFKTIADLCTIIFDANDEEIRYLRDFLIEGTKLKKNEPSMFLDIGGGRIQLDPLPYKEVRMWYSESNSPSKRTSFSERQIKKLFPIDKL